MAPSSLGDMPRGSIGEVTQADVERFRKTLKGRPPPRKPHDKPAAALDLEQGRRLPPPARRHARKTGPPLASRAGQRGPPP